MSDVLVFRLEGARYALPLARVVEAARRVMVTPLPGAPDVVLGAIVFRGRAIAAIDLRHRLGMNAQPARLADHMLIARAKRRDVALVVDEIVSLGELDLDALRPPPASGTQIAGIAAVGDEIWLVEDLDALLSLDEDAAIDRAMEAAT